MTTLTAYIDGIGLLGPGLTGWSESERILADLVPYNNQPTVLPAPALLPTAERRRSGAIVKTTLATGLEASNAAGLDPATLPCVYSASGSDGQNCHEICLTLASDDRHISPTRFHNSVHNAAAGYWSIATGAMTPISVLCAYDASFGAGLLEAITQVVVDHTATLLISSDTTYPEPLHRTRPIPDNFATAMVLTPIASAHSIAKISVSLTSDAALTMSNVELEQLRTSIPSARSLPLMQALAQKRSARVVLDYLPPLQIAIDIALC
ncbi:beta-ketoacyl synthase chain length factor [Sulfuriferula nivalis]|uniref:Beta-ketoacyl synthase-like N-terminal domain-containing protein n=1 Tax=Sulfuriferula nivalis TaxID=2675298 RepID=A0A809RKB0_9PROT|nr:beta-ketoacyl synthase chain length factor [Sulfuriferula nivalis]BBP02399.1 hypothetical protein SFSGTM_31070 [Sulfuriferula nivalis]